MNVSAQEIVKYLKVKTSPLPYKGMRRLASCDERTTSPYGDNNSIVPTLILKHVRLHSGGGSPVPEANPNLKIKLCTEQSVSGIETQRNRAEKSEATNSNCRCPSPNVACTELGNLGPQPTKRVYHGGTPPLRGVGCSFPCICLHRLRFRGKMRRD